MEVNQAVSRQYNKDSLNWYVHYYSAKQATPNGTEYFSRITFYDINKKRYKWIGEWVDKTGKVVFPF